MRMNIQKFSERVGVSAYTLRYCEKIGLLRDVVRLNNGHRCFSEQDVGWIMFIQRLKETGMPLAQIQEYADARVLGDVTLAARKILLN
jgi:DNA-binding transcriptional MerR regulator